MGEGVEDEIVGADVVVITFGIVVLTVDEDCGMVTNMDVVVVGHRISFVPGTQFVGVKTTGGVDGTMIAAVGLVGAGLLVVVDVVVVNN